MVFTNMAYLTTPVTVEIYKPIRRLAAQLVSSLPNFTLYNQNHARRLHAELSIFQVATVAIVGTALN